MPYIGAGSYLVVVGVDADPAAAKALAIAARGNAWWGRYREILDARRGNLTWGEPVVAPAGDGLENER